MAIEDSR